ncbi:MAG: hypothetical protein MUE31_02945 [Candidatus Nanopelagicales bacterium]|nr:hypothetical protein [Candidatus Nanopelagicales bacterium]
MQKPLLPLLLAFVAVTGCTSGSESELTEPAATASTTAAGCPAQVHKVNPAQPELPAPSPADLDLSGALLPPGRPESGIACIYVGSNGDSTQLLKKNSTLSAKDADALAKVVDAVDGTAYACDPVITREVTTLLRLTYGSGDSLWLVSVEPCSLTSNGQFTSYSTRLASLVRVVGEEDT